MAACESDGDGAATGHGTTAAGSESGSSGDTFSPAESAEYAAEIFCGSYFSCGCVALGGAYSSMDQCLAETAGGATFFYQRAAEAGLLPNTECLVARARRFEAVMCGTDWSVGGPAIECKSSYGTGGIGEACTFYDNAEGDDCEIDLRCWNGTCHDRQPQENDEPCPIADSDCAGQALCLDRAGESERFCEPFGALGEPCLAEFLCVDGLRCDETLTCVAAGGVGDPCDVDGDDCDPCLDCEAGACELVPRRAEGQGCGEDRDCAAGLWCHDSIGTCSAEPIACSSGIDSPPPDGLSNKRCRHVYPFPPE